MSGACTAMAAALRAAAPRPRDGERYYGDVPRWVRAAEQARHEQNDATRALAAALPSWQVETIGRRQWLLRPDPPVGHHLSVQVIGQMVAVSSDGVLRCASATGASSAEWLGQVVDIICGRDGPWEPWLEGTPADDAVVSATRAGGVVAAVRRAEIDGCCPPEWAAMYGSTSVGARLMADRTAAAEQLADVVGYWVGRAEIYGLAAATGQTADGFAAVAIAELTADDERTRAGAALTVVEWCAGTGPAAEWPDGWWQTPLGRLVAVARPELLDDPEVGAVPTATAAEVLGVTQAMVRHHVSTGRLERVGRGLVTAGSVAALAAAQLDESPVAPPGGADRPESSSDTP